MECPKELLGSYLDNRLDDVAKGRVDQHLEHCTPCASELRGLRSLFGLLEPSEVPELDSDFLQSVMEKIEREPAPIEIEQLRLKRVGRYLGWGSLALGVGGLAVILLLLWGTIDGWLWGGVSWAWSWIVLFVEGSPRLIELIQQASEIGRILRILLDSITANTYLVVAVGAMALIGWSLLKEIMDDVHDILG